jgi:pyruvate,water dikinase
VIADRLERAMLAALADDAPPALDRALARALDRALARYAAFYAPWAELSAVLSTLPRAAVARPSAVEVMLRRAAGGELDDATAVAALGALSPAWDVAVPTFGEQPQQIRDAIARVAALPPQRSPSAACPRPSPDALATLAADLAERDDLLFARAQRMVRVAILTTFGDDGFWVPLADLAAGEVRHDPTTARATAARQATYDMPHTVGATARHGTVANTLLAGSGGGGRATGRVVRYASLARSITARRGDVVVTRAITPALAVRVVGCAALVSETGGLLDHGAAMARELGIPYVVGCHDAWRQLPDDTMVLVDGEHGRVTVL